MKTVIFGEGKFVAINVEDPPGQIAVGLAVVEGMGSNGDTPIEMVEVAVHPLAAVAVTVYIVVAIGATVCTAPDKAPGLYKYEPPPPMFAPTAVSVVLEPEQIGFVEAVTVTVGGVFTVNVPILVPVPPPVVTAIV